LHSQVNPRRLVTGSVWDLLWLGVYFRKHRPPQRALLLGLGAGTAASQLQTLFPELEITAVEMDPVHVRLATEDFGVDSRRVRIHLGDARDFMGPYQGPLFDFIIDDLFAGTAGTPSRAVSCSSEWLSALTRCLTEDGILSINFADLKELKASGVRAAVGIRKRFKKVYGFRHPALENVIATLLPMDSTPADLRAQISSEPILAKALRSHHLRYQVRELKSR